MHERPRAELQIRNRLRPNAYRPKGDWTVCKDNATLNQPGGAITCRFHARDLHLVLGPSADDKPPRFKVLVDGKAPGADHGAYIDENGDGTMSDQRLYQLVRQSGAVGGRLFEIQFLDVGAQAFAFTFG
ncbi:hypothetical protein GA829_15220 [Mesorhizobium sp. INR15]|nr:hypothetical protein GA829_15220 [Mesorhizobium sp. INR15]